MTLAPDDSARLFEQSHLAGSSKDAIPIGALFEAVFSSYRQQRFAGLVEPEGDMLLFQYGVYDWGDGPAFEVDLTRQFIEDERDDDEHVFSQLHLTCYYEVDGTLSALGKGDRWCRDISELDQFTAWIEGHPVLAAVNSLPRLKTDLFWELT